MQHIVNFNNNTAEKEGGGSWARDAAIGGLEGGLAIHLTEPLINKWTGGAAHAAENAVKPTIRKAFMAGAKKTAIAAGVGGVSTLAVGAGLNALGNAMKKKPQSEEEYSCRGTHFVNFSYDSTTGEGFGNSQKSYGTQSTTGKDAQWLMKNDPQAYQEYKSQGRAQSDKLRANPNLNAANEGIPANQINKNINKTVVNNLGAKSPVANVKGFLGKVKNTAGRYGKSAAGLGGLAMTGMYVLPQIAAMLPQNQQQTQQ